MLHYVFSCWSFFFQKTDYHLILSNLNLLVTYIFVSLSFLKYGILNNNLILFKHIFMYIRSLHILVFLSLNIPIQINLNIKNFILSNFK